MVNNYCVIFWYLEILAGSISFNNWAILVFSSGNRFGNDKVESASHRKMRDKNMKDGDHGHQPTIPDSSVPKRVAHPLTSTPDLYIHAERIFPIQTQSLSFHISCLEKSQKPSKGETGKRFWPSRPIPWLLPTSQPIVRPKGQDKQRSAFPAGCPPFPSRS